jgi:cytochrome c oxidase subunit 2
MRAAAAAAAFVVFVLAASGCGSGVGRTVASSNVDTAHGKQLFGEKCAFCHTLKEANAQGKVGPNLDEAFRPSWKQGFKEATIRQVVADQIRFAGNYGEQGPTMPKNLVTGQDLDDVAAYVAAVAGPRPGVSISAPPAGGGGNTTTTATTPAGGGGGGNLAAGKTAFAASGCGGCHTLAAAGANGKVGPDLDKLKSYASTAKKPLKDFIHESIVDPNAYVQPGYPKGVMPSFAHLSADTINALVTFLAQSAKS